MDLFYKRRSIRYYKKEKISEEMIEKIVEAGLLAPSSRNGRPFEFIVIDDRELLEALTTTKGHGSSFIDKSPLCIVVIGDKTISEALVEDCSIASTYIQLEVENLGLGSCWIQVRGRLRGNGDSSESYVRSLLNIPEKYMVESIITIGYKAEKKEEHTLYESDKNKIHRQKYES